MSVVRFTLWPNNSTTRTDLGVCQPPRLEFEDLALLMSDSEVSSSRSVMKLVTMAMGRFRRETEKNIEEILLSEETVVRDEIKRTIAAERMLETWFSGGES